jgi:hypothetical protein
LVNTLLPSKAAYFYLQGFVEGHLQNEDRALVADKTCKTHPYAIPSNKDAALFRVQQLPASFCLRNFATIWCTMVRAGT